MISSSLRRVARATAAMLLGVSLVSAIPAFAQDQPQGSPANAQRGARMMGEMLMSLNPPLSDRQKDQIKQMRSAMEKQNQGVTDRTQRMANRKAFMDKIRSVLSPAQQADFKKKMDAMRAKFRAAHPDAGAPGSN